MTNQRTHFSYPEAPSPSNHEPNDRADRRGAPGSRSPRVVAGFIAAGLALSGCSSGPYVTRGGSLSPDDIRSATVVVREVPHKDVQALFEEMAHMARSSETMNPDIRALLIARAKSQGHGSGFVLVRALKEGPSPFIVTNHHVVEYASTVEVSFEDNARLSGCNVIYDDRRADLAVIDCESKSSPHFSWGLGLSKETPHDLDSVIAAGFPALGGAPAYQSTQGKVSNSRYKDDDKRVLLQHTAPIDPGSSGGPLLDEEGQLLGVNTLKARGRDSVYLAVPTHAVEAILDKAILAKQSFADPQKKKATLLAACKAFADEVASEDATNEAVSDFISNELIAKHGMESFNMVFQAMPDRHEQLTGMFLGDPIAAMRFAIVLRLRIEVDGAGGECACESIHENDLGLLERESGVRVKFRVGGDRHEGKWTVEHGHWKLAGFQF